MNKLSLSIKIYVVLIITLAILAVINIFLPQGSFLTNFASTRTSSFQTSARSL